MTRTLLFTRLRHQLQGVVFLVIAALFTWLCIAFYQKTFSTAAMVKLETDSVGNQMRAGADVKVRGVRIGEVRTISSVGNHAELSLALDPAQLDMIPVNVSARMLPKTLFGERYVSLQLPQDPMRARLTNGDVIPQDRSSNAIELDQVLTDLLPTLDAVQPEKLSSTLGSVATALNGKGEQLGTTLVALNSYLQKLNKSVPDLTADMRGVADLSGTYSSIAPQFLQSLVDLGGTARTISDKQGQLAGTLSGVNAAAQDVRNFLSVNKNNIIDLANTAQGTLKLLARYSSEYPCLLGQIADRLPAAERAFGKGTSTPHIMQVTLEIIDSRGRYVPGDEPKYDDKRGPQCYAQAKSPNYFPQYPPGGPIKDGSSHPTAPQQAKDKTVQWNSLLTGILGWAQQGAK